MRERGRGCEGRAPVCMVIDICVTLRAPEMQPSAPRVAIYVYGVDWQGFSQVYTVGGCLVWCWSGWELGEGRAHFEARLRAFSHRAAAP